MRGKTTVATVKPVISKGFFSPLFFLMLHSTELACKLKSNETKFYLSFSQFPSGWQQAFQEGNSFIYLPQKIYKGIQYLTELIKNSQPVHDFCKILYSVHQSL